MRTLILSSTVVVLLSGIIIFMLLSSPLLNDISTDLVNPPEFFFLRQHFPHRNFEFPKDSAEAHRALYPDLAGLAIANRTSKDVFEVVVRVAAQQPRWQIVHQDQERFRLEGTAVTAWLHFRDDFVVEIRPPGPALTESKFVFVEMRSKSRIGKSDLGANAKRIRNFLAAISQELAK